MMTKYARKDAHLGITSHKFEPLSTLAGTTHAMPVPVSWRACVLHHPNSDTEEISILENGPSSFSQRLRVVISTGFSWTGLDSL